MPERPPAAPQPDSQVSSLLTTPVSYRARPRALLVATAAMVMSPLLGSASVARAATGGDVRTIHVGSGETLTISSTRSVSCLVIEDGGQLAAPDGYSLTVTVDGIEVGSMLTGLYDRDGIPTYIAAGTYSGDVVITVASANTVTYNSRSWPFRQAVFVDADGVDAGKSVLAAVRGGQLRDTFARNVSLTSRGEAFNGFYVAGGAYTLTSPSIRFVGNGRNDFCGYGAAVYATGAGTALRVDGADIRNKGVVRTAVVADGSSTVVVKDSTLSCEDGILPEGYENTGDTTFMMTCPWLLGMYGNVRTTNLLGQGTKATYLNSAVLVENWGVLSVDAGRNCVLTAINSVLRSTGTDGYGSYGIGNVTEHFLGNRVNVGSYIMINFGAAGTHYGDSSSAAVRELNEEYGLGLSEADIRSVVPQRSYLHSRKFGWMWQAVGPVVIDGGTTATSEQTMFLSKAAQSSVAVDGSGGATVTPANGVLYQLMDNDNPGRVNVTDKPWSAVYTKPYVEPTAPATKSTTWDPTADNSTDARGVFSNIRLEGDFYNSVLGGGNANLQGKNLVLDFDRVVVKGTISASTAKHRVSTIDFSNYEELGVVTNTPAPVVNNGVIVSLQGTSTWEVSGTSYLSSLTVGYGSKVVSAEGGAATVTVDGTAVTPAPGTTYTGAITVTP